MWILEYIGKTGINPDPYTLGELLHMLRSREEELQIAWACSAQNPDLLPEKYQKAKKSNPSATSSIIRAVFE